MNWYSNDYALSLSLSLSLSSLSLFSLSQFPHSNISLILSKLRGPASAHLSHIETAFASADPNNTGTLLFDQFSYVTLMLRVVSKKYFLSVAFFIFIVYFLCFRSVVQSLTHTLLNQHEVITLARHYGKKQYPLLTTLISLIQDDLRKKNYTGFAELHSVLASCDQDGLGFISKDLLRHICRGNEFPLSDQLIDGTIMK